MQVRTEGGRDGWIELVHGGMHLLAKGDAGLHERVRSALDAAGDDSLPDVVTDALTVGGVRGAPDFAIVDESEGRVLVRGGARARLVAADGASRAVLAPARGPWTDEDVPGGTETVVLATGEPAPHAARPVQEDAVAPAAAPLGAAAPTVNRPQFHDGHLVGPRVEPPVPAVAATGMLPVTGDERAEATPEPGSGPGAESVAPAEQEPPGGQGLLLRLPTGDAVVLDRAVRIGRAPRAAEDGGDLPPHLVRVASPDNEVSRTHVEVVREGGQVLVRDLGSTNGTVVARSGEAAVRLRPGEERVIGPGATITLAGHVSIVLEAD